MVVDKVLKHTKCVSGEVRDRTFAIPGINGYCQRLKEISLRQWAENRFAHHGLLQLRLMVRPYMRTERTIWWSVKQAFIILSMNIGTGLSADNARQYRYKIPSFGVYRTLNRQVGLKFNQQHARFSPKIRVVQKDLTVKSKSSRIHESFSRVSRSYTI